MVKVLRVINVCPYVQSRKYQLHLDYTNQNIMGIREADLYIQYNGWICECQSVWAGPLLSNMLNCVEIWTVAIQYQLIQWFNLYNLIFVLPTISAYCTVDVRTLPWPSIQTEHYLAILPENRTFLLSDNILRNNIDYPISLTLNLKKYIVN